MLLDRLDELPLRRHEIRGNPAGLLARLLARIDELKAERSGRPACEERGRASRSAASDEAEREAARRELEFAELYTAHDRILAERRQPRPRRRLPRPRLPAGRARPTSAAELADRFEYLMVDELEETTPAQRALLAGARRPTTRTTSTRSRTAAGRRTTCPPAGLASADLHPDGDVVGSRRTASASRSCASGAARNERAQAQAVAREVEHLVAGGAEPEAICVARRRPGRRGRRVAAAMEERGIPFHLSGPAALFHRPEVRDAIAWLRVLADPDDSPAAARALTRPPIELRSGDLARLTTIARRRKHDMVAACEAALDSPQFQPEARERIQAFLRSTAPPRRRWRSAAPTSSCGA